MVKIMENPIKMDDLGGKPTIFGNTHLEVYGRRKKIFVEDLLFFVEALPALASVMSGQVVVPPGCRAWKEPLLLTLMIFG